MPPMTYWFAGIAIVPTTIYAIYNNMYLPRITTQSDLERLSEAVARPRQLLERDLMVLGGQETKLSAWTTPNGQRDVPYITSNDATKNDKIPNRTKYDCDLPPYRQPSGILPQTNAEKLTLFATIQYLRLALLAGCSPGDGVDLLTSHPALWSSTSKEEPLSFSALQIASIAAHNAPKYLAKKWGLLLAQRNSCGDRPKRQNRDEDVDESTPVGPQVATSSRVESPSIGTGFTNITDSHREELLRRLAHIEMTQLFLLNTEGDIRFIPVSRIARHARLLAPFDVLVVPNVVEELSLRAKLSTSLEKRDVNSGAQRRGRFLSNRQDSHLVSKPLHVWVRQRAVASSNSSGRMTVVEVDGSPIEAEMSPSSSEKAPSSFPGGVITPYSFLEKLGANQNASMSVSDALHTAGYSKMLLAPYLRFRDSTLNKDEKLKSSFAFTVYYVLFKVLSDDKSSREPSSARPGKAQSSTQFITTTIGNRIGKAKVEWLEDHFKSNHFTKSLASWALCALALVVYHFCALTGLAKSRYSDYWLTDMKYLAANWLVHDVLQISTELTVATGGDQIDTLSVDGTMAQLTSEAQARVASEWRKTRGGGDVLLAFTPSLWIEELALFAAAGAVVKTVRNPTMHAEPTSITVNTFAIATLPAVTYANYFDFMLRLKADKRLSSNAKLRIGIGNRADLLPLVSDLPSIGWSGFPSAPSPLLAMATVRLENAGSTLTVNQVLDDCEIAFRPVAVSGTLQVASAPLATAQDPLLYSIPDKKIVPVGLDTENAVKQMQGRGAGSDENVFISDEEEREKFQQSSQRSAIGGKVGQRGNTLDNNKLTPELEKVRPQSSTAVTNPPSSVPKSIETTLWRNERMVDSGFIGFSSLFGRNYTDYTKLRTQTVEASRTAAMTEPLLCSLINPLTLVKGIFGGEKRTGIRRRLTFHISNPVVAIPSAEVPTPEAKESKVALQFATIDHLQALLLGNIKVNQHASEADETQSIQSAVVGLANTSQF